MPAAVKPVPEGYHTATPYLIVRGAAKAIEFYKRAFGASEIMRFPGPDGAIAHAEIEIGNSRIMLSDESPAWNAFSPEHFGGTPLSIMLYVPDSDAVFARAVEAGAKVVRPVQDQFYGDRSGTITDPFGHQWTISTHKEDVPAEELHRRMQDAMKQQPAG